MKHLLNVLFLSLLLLSGQSSATSLLTGSVTFNEANSLYTYTYTLDETGFEKDVNSFGILQNTSFNYQEPLPISNTKPEGWDFVLAGVDTTISNGEQVSGTFWTFWKRAGYSEPYADIQTFSFTTERGVRTSSENNYFIDSRPCEGFCEFEEVGQIVGPEVITLNYVEPPIVSPVPENEIYAMFMVGLGLMSFVSRRRKTTT